MEENNIMTTVEEVADAAEEIVETGSDKNFGYGLAIGGAVVVIGSLAYKYAVKPLASKIKDKIKSKKQNDESEANLEVKCDCDVESDEE